MLELILAVALSGAQAQIAPQGTSLLGKPLIPVAPAENARQRLEDNLASAREQYDKNPNDADAIIWLGRRLAYLGRYRDAIAAFTEGIQKHPADARMYRHRGHRYISVRELDKAAADLGKAAQLVAGKPDRDRAGWPAEREEHPDEHAEHQRVLPPGSRALPPRRVRAGAEGVSGVRPASRRIRTCWWRRRTGCT